MDSPSGSRPRFYSKYESSIILSQVAGQNRSGRANIGIAEGIPSQTFPNEPVGSAPPCQPHPGRAERLLRRAGGRYTRTPGARPSHEQPALVGCQIISLLTYHCQEQGRRECAPAPVDSNDEWTQNQPTRAPDNKRHGDPELAGPPRTRKAADQAGAGNWIREVHMSTPRQWVVRNHRGGQSLTGRLLNLRWPVRRR
jgi:hypothetical protein